MNDETNSTDDTVPSVAPEQVDEMYLDVEFPSGLVLTPSAAVEQAAFEAWLNSDQRNNTAGRWYHQNTLAEAFAAGRESRDELISALLNELHRMIAQAAAIQAPAQEGGAGSISTGSTP